jgi:CHAD domain-containing protein
MTTNPKTIAYQEMMSEINKLIYTFTASGIEVIKSTVTSSYLHQLEEEVKRLREKWEFYDKEVCEGKYNNCVGKKHIIKSEIELCESAIKEIKALQ